MSGPSRHVSVRRGMMHLRKGEPNEILITFIVDPESALEEVFKSACERIIG
jgi:hypothetical protein